MMTGTRRKILDRGLKPLPKGWTRKIVKRTQGCSQGRLDIYIYSPDKKKFRSKNEIRKYLVANSIDNLCIDDFDFSIKNIVGYSSSPSAINKKHPTQLKPTQRVIMNEMKESVSVAEKSVDAEHVPRSTRASKIKSQADGQRLKPKKTPEKKKEQSAKTTTVPVLNKLSPLLKTASATRKECARVPVHRKGPVNEVTTAKSDVQSAINCTVRSLKRPRLSSLMRYNNNFVENVQQALDPKFRNVKKQGTKKKKAASEKKAALMESELDRTLAAVANQLSFAVLLPPIENYDLASPEKTSDAISPTSPEKTSHAIFPTSPDKTSHAITPVSPEKTSDAASPEKTLNYVSPASPKKTSDAISPTTPEKTSDAVPLTSLETTSDAASPEKTLNYVSPKPSPKHALIIKVIQPNSSVPGTQEPAKYSLVVPEAMKSNPNLQKILNRFSTDMQTNRLTERKRQSTDNSVSNGACKSACETDLPESCPVSDPVKKVSDNLACPQVALSVPVTDGTSLPNPKKPKLSSYFKTVEEQEVKCKYFRPPTDDAPVAKEILHAVKWKPPKSPYNLIQESLYQNPWKLLIATIFLNRTAGKVAIPLVWKFFDLWPTPEAAYGADADQLASFLQPLGLNNKRAYQIMRFSYEYRHKLWLYPKQLYGIDKYGNDSFRIFCRNEWRKVKPMDHKLNLYHNWLCQNWKALGV